MAIITAAMFTGNGNPALARDSRFAVIMIVLNGMVGLSLLLGGLRYHEQEYNLQGATGHTLNNAKEVKKHVAVPLHPITE